MKCNEYGESNFNIDFSPYIGLTIDGIENWIRAMNNSTDVEIAMPVFDDELGEYCKQLRETTKLWDLSCDVISVRLRDIYQQSEQYYSNSCNKIAKYLRLYDIYGVDKANKN